jgi:hypothetical protein
MVNMVLLDRLGEEHARIFVLMPVPVTATPSLLLGIVCWEGSEFSGVLRGVAVWPFPSSYALKGTMSYNELPIVEYFPSLQVARGTCRERCDKVTGMLVLL